jgi:multidrug resistance efflux pump
VPGWLKVLNKNKVRYTRVNRSHPCHLHDNGPVWEEQLEQTVKEIAEMEASLAQCTPTNHTGGCSQEKHQDAKEKLQLLKSIQRQLQPKVDKYRRHLQQYEASRKHVKQIESDLNQGSAWSTETSSTNTTPKGLRS